MNRTALGFAAAIPFIVLAGSTQADEAGVRLTKEELATLLPGTKAVYVIKGGSTHAWTNETDGKFVASTDAKTISGVGMGGGYTARGTWSVSDDGKYCVNIEWRRYPENWCRAMYRTADGGYYLTDTDEPGAPKRKIELSK
ncbi:MAG TPA: DUF995 domain-containing protein [Thiobacillaceae bacterium]|nr:DUF995 domain-containing protein [Thiobacillaceae bacterium]